MNESLLVPSIFGQKIGVMMEDVNGISFQYHKDFNASLLPLSPISLPFDPRRVFNYYDAIPTKGLPGIFADSIPDSFGTLAIREYFKRKRGIVSGHFKLSAIEMLSYIGDDGIGAIEYAPMKKKEVDIALDIKAYALEMKKLYSGKADEVINEILAHASAGGARPKASVLWNKREDTLCLCHTSSMTKELEPYIIKFDEEGKELTKWAEQLLWEIPGDPSVEEPRYMAARAFQESTGEETQDLTIVWAESHGDASTTFNLTQGETKIFTFDIPPERVNDTYLLSITASGYESILEQAYQICGVNISQNETITNESTACVNETVATLSAITDVDLKVLYPTGNETGYIESGNTSEGLTLPFVLNGTYTINVTGVEINDTLEVALRVYLLKYCLESWPEPYIGFDGENLTLDSLVVVGDAVDSGMVSEMEPLIVDLHNKAENDTRMVLRAFSDLNESEKNSENLIPIGSVGKGVSIDTIGECDTYWDVLRGCLKSTKLL